jgi:beta-galactosidase/beta-glucuronidase
VPRQSQRPRRAGRRGAARERSSRRDPSSWSCRLDPALSHSLDGTWEIRLEPGAAWREIRVPFAFEAPLSGIGAGDEVHERVRYRRTFRVPDEWRERTLLHFGAVDWRATVFLDGRELGTHEGGYAHFSFDAGRLATGSEHELVVDVFDPADDAFGQAKGKQRGSHDIWYTRTTGIWRSVWLEGLRDDDLPAISKPRFPTIEARGRELYLNGAPLRIAGVLDQGFWPDGVYTPPSDDALRADVEAAKAFGFNLVRKHVKVEDPRWYAWCDRLGLLVAQDLPSSHSLATEEARARFRRECLELVDQLRGHPSIVMWIVFNEDWGEPPPAFQRELVAAIRAADPSRLVVDASGWNQLDDTDLVDIHDYGAELTKHRGIRDDIPLWFGELGGFHDYRGIVEQVPREAAGFVWTQLTDVEQEQNGLLTYDRRPKVDAAEVAAVNEAFLRA